MTYLITYEDALKLVEEYNDFNFSKSEFRLVGNSGVEYKVVTFTYFICDFNHFENPIKDSGIKGYDMRGVTFVFNEDGSLYKRFLMLRKFFNIDQVENTLYHNIRDKKIKSITEKEDGTLIAFMNLPDGTVFAKTIGSFDNEYIDAASRIAEENELLKDFIKNMLSGGFTPMFEYVSYDNRIVLKYGKPELRFIGARHNDSGIFNPAYMIKEMLEDAGTHCPVKVAKYIDNVTLEELIEKAKVEEDKEGWVIEFEDGQMVKIKTEWYFRLHGLRTDNVFREDFVIKNYLEDKMDDITSQLDEKEDEDAFKFIERVKQSVDIYIKKIDENVDELKRIYVEEYNSDWNKYAKNMNNEAFFGLSVFAIQRPEDYNKRKVEFIINKTKHLKKAKNFVDRWSTLEDDVKSPWRK